MRENEPRQLPAFLLERKGSFPYTPCVSIRDFWNAIDAVLVINLDDRPDKWEDMQQAWGRYIPGEKLHRISAVKGVELPGYLEKPWFRERTGARAVVCAGQAGCVLSHRKAVAYAKEKGFQRVLVLEDDIHLNPGIFETFYSALTKVILEQLDKGILYLGCHHDPTVLYKEAEVDNRGIYRISGALGTYAFIIGSGAYDVFLKHYPEPENVWSWVAYYKAVDSWLATRFSRYGDIFAIYPEIVEMPASISDISQEKVSYEIHSTDVSQALENYDIFRNKIRQRNDVGRILFALDSWRRWIRSRLLGFSPFKRK